MMEAGVQEGQVLGRYELLLRVAQGGMARVWAGRLHGTRGFRKLVAVKTILPGVMGEERLEQMFLEEATLAALIHHPNVVDTLELGEHDGTLFMALEWVDGEPLSLVLTEALKGDGIPLPIAVNLVAQACKGLHAAHELTDQTGAPLGLVHRDVSPHNVLVSYSGIVKLLDFGIAKATHRSSGLTEAGEIKGKLAYMAPEQVRGREIDRRTDIFALGTLLYTVTTGRHPWKGEHPGATTERLISERPAKPPSIVCPGYPEALAQVVLKALEKDPDKRFATAAEMLGALDDAMPSSLEGNAEARVSEFMQKLVGPRGVERRKQIRLAGDLLDLKRASTGVVISSGTSGSTSAVAVEASVSIGPQSQPGAGASLTGPTPSIAIERRRFDKFVWVAVAAGFAGCLGFAARQATTPTAEPSTPVAAATLIAPPAAPLASVAAPAVASSDAPAPASAEPAPLASAAADDEPGTRRKRHAERVSVSRALAAPAAPHAAPASSSVGAPVAAAPPAPSAAPVSVSSGAAAKPATPNASTDAWNPKAFGNRY